MKLRERPRNKAQIPRANRPTVGGVPHLKAGGKEAVRQKYMAKMEQRKGMRSPSAPTTIVER